MLQNAKKKTDTGSIGNEFKDTKSMQAWHGDAVISTIVSHHQGVVWPSCSLCGCQCLTVL